MMMITWYHRLEPEKFRGFGGLQFTIIDLIKIYFKSENIELEQEILIKVWFKC